MIIIVLLALILIGFLIVFFIHFITKKRIVNEFKRSNVIVFGKKRKGKDILFQCVINARKTKYFSNINYGGKKVLVSPKEVSVSPNTYVNFINNHISIIKKDKRLEGVDVYLSDGGIILPSQYDSVLHKTFPSLPIAYALSGHLWNNNIHINTQNLERVWKALREQADYFIKIRRRIILPFFIVLFTTEYDKYQSASESLMPMPSRMLNQYSRAESDKFTATHGFIKNGFIIVRKKSLHYDTRAYHKIIFGKKAPKKYKKK